MNRQEYLRALDAALSNLVSAQERENILRYYEEYFDEAGPDGEQALIEELGNPFELAGRLAEEGGFAPGTAAPRSGMSRGAKTGLIAVGTAAACLLLLGALKIGMFGVPKKGVAAFESKDAISTQIPVATVMPGSEVEISSGVDSNAYLGEAFAAVKLEIAVGDVELYTEGDKYQVELSWDQSKNYEMTAAIRKGELLVTSTGSGSGVNVGGYAAKVTIIVPEGSALTDVELDTGMGDIRVDRIAAVELEADTGMGDITVENCTVSDTLKADTGMGSIDFQGYLAQETELDTGMGDIDAKVLDERVKCSYELESGLGEVRIDGRKQGSFATGVGSVPDLELEASSGLGDVTVQFGA